MGSGFRTFTAGEVLTASNVQNFLMDQSVMSFASAAARDASVVSPEEGMIAVITGSDLVTIYTGSAWVEYGRYGNWQSYTPTFTASTTDPVIGSGGFPESTGVYQRIGNLVTGWMRIAAGNSGTSAGSGTYRFGLPITGDPKIFTNRGAPIGAALYYDQSASSAGYSGVAAMTDTGDYCIIRAAQGVIGSSLPGWASNDIVYINFNYEAA